MTRDKTQGAPGSLVGNVHQPCPPDRPGGPRRGRARPPTSRRKFLGRLSLPERTFVADALRTETVGGVLLLAAAVAALIWANTPLERQLRGRPRTSTSGPAALGLDLSVAALGRRRAARRLLLRRRHRAQARAGRRRAARPQGRRAARVAALCGMAVPALVYVAVNVIGGGSLAGLGRPDRHRHRLRARRPRRHRHLPARRAARLPAHPRRRRRPLRDPDHRDLLHHATSTSLALGGAVAGLAVFWLLLRKGVRGWYVYVPLALVIWALMYNSGVHATIAGVAMGLMLRCTRREGEDALPRRAHRAPGAPALGRARRAAVRPLRRRVSRLRRRARRRLHPAGDARRGPRPGRRQDRRHLRRHLAHRPLHPGRAQRRPRWAGRLRRRRPSPASASPSPCSSANSPSPTTRH